jgi:hypothetical protein
VAPRGVPMQWYTALATMALEAIEAGPNANLLMNLEGIKEHLRNAQQGIWPKWADVSPGVPVGAPDFDAVRDKRMSELTPAQQDDAMELWIRDQLATFLPYYRERVEFLLKRLDDARGVSGTRDQTFDQAHVDGGKQ